MDIATQTGVLRTMTLADVEDVVAVQEPGAVRALADVFPQELYPFPRQTLTRRWQVEVADPATSCYVILLGHQVAGFAATRGDELLHFGTSVATWGSGLAATAHDELLVTMLSGGCRRAWLTVFTANSRARRFYERLGWEATGAQIRGSFPPYAELLRYERDLPRDGRGGS